MADLIHDRANDKRLRFSDVLQADVLLCIASSGRGWFPRCLVYGHSVGKLELFVRAVTDGGFGPLRTILKVDTPQNLLLRIESDEMQQVLQSEMFRYTSGPATACLNLDDLKRYSGAATS